MGLYANEITVVISTFFLVPGTEPYSGLRLMLSGPVNL